MVTDCKHIKTKLTHEDIKLKIVGIKYFMDGTLTICVLTLKNGFKVTGESACIDEANYDEKIGREIAYNNAEEKIWQLEGYLIKEKLYHNPSCNRLECVPLPEKK